MAKHKGIGVNEVASRCSFYAPYLNSSGNTSWGWFTSEEEAAKNDKTAKEEHAKSWDNDGVLIGHATVPFVIRGGRCYSDGAAGVLCTDIADGHANDYNGFRPVLVL